MNASVSRQQASTTFLSRYWQGQQCLVSYSEYSCKLALAVIPSLSFWPHSWLPRLDRPYPVSSLPRLVPTPVSFLPRLVRSRPYPVSSLPRTPDSSLPRLVPALSRPHSVSSPLHLVPIPYPVSSPLHLIPTLSLLRRECGFLVDQILHKSQLTVKS